MPKKKSSQPKNVIANFEKSLQELEILVSEMENEDISLEDSLSKFERGISLTKTCQQALNQATQKVSLLTEENGQTTLEPFVEQNES